MDELENRFTYHAPFGTQSQRYEQIWHEAYLLAELLISMTPKCREQSLALTHLEEAVFWANASIARNEKELGE